MKECPAYRESIKACAFDALEPEAVRRLQQHLDTCAGCREYTESVRAIYSSLVSTAERLPTPQPPPGFHDRLSRRIYADAEKPKRESMLARLSAWFTVPRIGFAAALGVLILLGILALNREQPIVAPVAVSVPVTPAAESGAPNLLAYQRAFNQSFEELDALTLRDDNRLAMDGGAIRRFGGFDDF